VRRSIRIRLLVWLLALLIPLSAAGGWLLIQVFGNRLLRDIDVALDEEAETVAELLATPAGSDTVGNLLNHIAGETAHGAQKYITITRDGRVIAEVPQGAGQVIDSTDPRLRVVRRAAPDRLTVSIAVSAAGALHAKQRLTSLLGIGGPLLLLFVGGGLWLIISRALKPLEQASRQLDEIGAENLSVRVAVENRDDEVGRMVTVLNRMLDRLERAVAELRRFTADAAHELRTPLTVLRAGLEVALARERPAAEYRAALSEALSGIVRMSRLAEDLLTLARLEAAGAPRAAAPVDLNEVLHELADAAAESARQQRLTIEVKAAPGLWVHGNTGDLYRLFNNLIDNAVRHGVNGAEGDGPKDGSILLVAERVADHVNVTIADSGPGIPVHDQGRVFERFYRGHDKPAAPTGTGLGLSIALQIVHTHGGQVELRNRNGGGCVVTVTLPAMASTQPGSVPG
jgi:signal transduction histidine kinase